MRRGNESSFLELDSVIPFLQSLLLGARESFLSRELASLNFIAVVYGAVLWRTSWQREDGAVMSLVCERRGASRIVAQIPCQHVVEVAAHETAVVTVSVNL